MLKVLFTGGGGAGNEALFHLLDQKYSVHFADADLRTIDPVIPAERCHKLSWASDPDFIARTGDLCKQLDIDLLVPGVDEELYLLANAAACLGKTRLLLPHAEYIAQMLDKLTMAQALERKQLPVPRTCRLNDDWRGLTFPCIAKPRHGRGSRGVSILRHEVEAAQLSKMLGPAANDYVIQEQAIGQEFTVQMVADAQGKLRAVVPVRVDIKRGITLRAETCREPKVMATCQDIHTAYPTPGCYNIQLIMTTDGRALPFEINPRVSTTLCLVVAAGVDPIAIFTSGTKFEAAELQSFTPGLKLQRHWVNHFIG